jgi:peptidoglycan/LPS O-acetylase OafA/YrhL
VLVPLALCLLSADLWIPVARRGAGGPGALVVAGATLAVLCPLLVPRVARWLEHRPVQWLGSRSFSLYLVHLPIVIAAANALHRPSLLLLLAVAVPACLLAAEGFFRVAEAPVHRLARVFAARHGRAGRSPWVPPVTTMSSSAPRSPTSSAG